MKNNPLQILNTSFQEAAQDYIFLLEKKYPQKLILKMIGDRYALSGVQRSMLYRGLSRKDHSELRKEKKITKDQINNSPLHIDGFNVLITVGSYLNGNTVFICTDHFLRDASEIHGKAFRSYVLNKSLLLILDYLKKISVGNIYFYLDQPVSYSKTLCTKINDVMKHYQIEGEAIIKESPDHFLRNVEESVIASSDSTIITNSKSPVFDLAFHTVTHNFQPDFIDLNKIVNL
ncbi:MAG: DUF434 domain-containing protein [Bacteroidales bacterium]|nr:DUF434 domain-containing protein [Bacteroidales bacterium]